MKSVYLEKNDCCGCSACYNICSSKAIEMKRDVEGFLYPFIDQDLCINCEECLLVCPFIIEKQLKEKHEPSFYYLKHKSEDVLYNSSSGGAFTAISDIFLNNDDVVYGADFNENFDVVHVRADNVEQRNRLRISKYSQSDLTDVFKQVKTDLQNQKKVLFTGTPCQNAGLKGFIGNSYLIKELYFCDLICHSIPSPLVFKDYIKYLEATHNSKLLEVKFRTKINGWNRELSNKGFKYIMKNESNQHYFDDLFFNLFFGEMTITRPSCEKCPFTDIYRVGDITIADYWGIEKYAPDLMDSKGVSLVLINSEKGDSLFQEIKNDVYWEKRNKNESLAEQKRLYEPVKFPKNREKFWEDYINHGFECIAKKTYEKYK